MIVKVTLLPRKKGIQDMEMPEGTTGQDLLTKLDMAFDAHIITRDNEPISIDEELKDNDDIGIIKVVSGG